MVIKPEKSKKVGLRNGEKVTSKSALEKDKCVKIKPWPQADGANRKQLVYQASEIELDKIKPAATKCKYAKRKEGEKWYTGHRARMAERIGVRGVDSLTEPELLEQILMRCIPRRDVKPIAYELLERFHNLHGVFYADAQDLMQVKGVSGCTASFFELMRYTCRLMAMSQVDDRPLLADWDRLLDYVNLLYTGEKVEVLYVLYLDAKLRLVRAEKLRTGSVSHVPVEPVEILKKAFETRACHVVMAHNHPSGELQPSVDDVRTTEAIAEALFHSKIQLAEHLIVGDNRHVHSMRAQGILEPYIIKRACFKIKK